MSDPNHIPADWMTDRQRMRAQHHAPRLPRPAPLPTPIIHFGWLTGWKSRQEFTACGLRAKNLIRLEQRDEVTCPRCLAKLQERPR